MFSKGYNDTGIKDITDAVQIPKGSFYNHFSSKEEFGLEVLANYMEGGLKIHEDRLLRSTASPLTRIKEFYNGMINEYSKVLDFKLGCMMSNFSTEMADVNENFRSALKKGFNEQEATIVQCLVEAREHGGIPEDIDCQLYGSSIINGWHGALVRMKAEGNAKPLNDFKKFFIDKL